MGNTPKSQAAKHEALPSRTDGSVEVREHRRSVVNFHNCVAFLGCIRETVVTNTADWTLIGKAGMSEGYPKV